MMCYYLNVQCQGQRVIELEDVDCNRMLKLFPVHLFVYGGPVFYFQRLKASSVSPRVTVSLEPT